MKKEVWLLVILIIFSAGFVSASAIEDTLHLNIQTTYSNGSIQTGTFAFVFNISTNPDCAIANVVYSNSTTLTTDSRGLVSYYLENLSLGFSEQYWLCHYKDGTLINATKFARVPYVYRANVSDNLNSTANYQIANLNVTGIVTATGINLTFPTCSGTEKLTFDGTSFTCATDQAGTSGSGIVESGNNSNGYYIQFADGTMMQWGVLSQSTSSTASNQFGSTSGTSNYDTDTITFPLPFIATPTVTLGGGGGSTWSASYSVTASNFVSQPWGPYASSASNTSWYAIGRWTNLTNISVNDTTWAVNATTGNVGLFDSTKNLTIGKLLTFGLLEAIDNLVDGWLRINGNLNVTGNLSLGNGQISYNNSANSYYYYNGTQWVAFGTGTGSDSLWTNVSGTATYIGSVNITGNLTLGGDVTGQNVSRVRAYKTNAQTFTDATYQKVQLNNESFDTLGEYDNATNYRFTATEAGYYSITGSLLTANSAWTINDVVEIAVRKNNVIALSTRFDSEATVVKYVSLNVNGVLYLAVGDYVEFWAYINRGSNTAIYSAVDAGAYNYLDVQRLHSPITIGSTAGVPTGAMVAFTTDCPTGWTFNHTTNGTGIVDSGGNVNGSYIKFSDGTMMQWGSTPYGVSPSPWVVTLPTAYIDANYMIQTNANVTTANIYVITQLASTKTTTTFQAYKKYLPTDGNAGGTSSESFYWTTMGRWTNTPQPTLNYCVKTGEDSSISNTIWAESGANIILNNQSKSLNLSNTSTTYYAPNASQPSVGTLHLFDYDGTVRTILNMQAGSAAWASVDASSYVPANAKSILGSYYMDTGTSASGAWELSYAFDSDNVSGTPTILTHPIVRMGGTASAAVAAGTYQQGGNAIIPLNSTRGFYYYRQSATNAASTRLNIVVIGYYI